MIVPVAPDYGEVFQVVGALLTAFSGMLGVVGAWYVGRNFVDVLSEWVSLWV